MNKFIRFPEILEDFEPTIQLRRAKESDRDFLFDLKAKALKPYIEKMWGWDKEWQEEYFSKNFTLENIEIILLLGMKIGCISVIENEDSLEIALIEILPKYQNQGIGSWLIQKIIQDAKIKGKTLKIQVLKTNPKALRLYKKLGFEEYKQNPTHFNLKKE